jgi:hypothetical protein
MKKEDSNIVNGGIAHPTRNIVIAASMIDFPHASSHLSKVPWVSKVD